MSIKYYTHFLLQERPPKVARDYRGVVAPAVLRLRTLGHLPEVSLARS